MLYHVPDMCNRKSNKSNKYMKVFTHIVENSTVYIGGQIYTGI